VKALEQTLWNALQPELGRVLLQCHVRTPDLVPSYCHTDAKLKMELGRSLVQGQLERQIQ